MIGKIIEFEREKHTGIKRETYIDGGVDRETYRDTGIERETYRDRERNVQ